MDSRAQAIGATATVTRTLSEADLALFALVTGAAEAPADEAQPNLGLAGEARYRQAAPPALLASLMTTSAAQHSERPAWARFLSAQIRFIEPAYTDDMVRAQATVTAVDDATGALRVSAHCESVEGRRLAEGDFLLRAD